MSGPLIVPPPLGVSISSSGGGNVSATTIINNVWPGQGVPVAGPATAVVMAAALKGLARWDFVFPANALFATPQPVMPAVAGIIIPIFWSLEKDTTIAGGTSGNFFQLTYAGDATVLLPSLSADMNNVRKLFSGGGGQGGTFFGYPPAFNPRGKGVNLSLSATPTGGTSTVTGTILFYVQS